VRCASLPVLHGETRGREVSAASSVSRARSMRS
jgi:hypothetical protein